jgi:hypothetical protein
MAAEIVARIEETEHLRPRVQHHALPDAESLWWMERSIFILQTSGMISASAYAINVVQTISITLPYHILSVVSRAIPLHAGVQLQIVICIYDVFIDHY